MIKRQFILKEGSKYNVTLMLTANIKDWGTFDTFDENGKPLPNDNYIVSGVASSRLAELRTYSQSSDLAKQYKISSSIDINGLDLTQTGNGIYVYYIDKIRYVDTVVNGVTTTTFSIPNLGYNPANFDNTSYLKDESKIGMIENPKIDKDVFIVRQQTSVFESNYRLRAINGLNDLLYYAGGNYFNIYDNT